MLRSNFLKRGIFNFYDFRKRFSRKTRSHDEKAQTVDLVAGEGGGERGEHHGQRLFDGEGPAQGGPETADGKYGFGERLFGRQPQLPLQKVVTTRACTVLSMKR